MNDSRMHTEKGRNIHFGVFFARRFRTPEFVGLSQIGISKDKLYVHNLGCATERFKDAAFSLTRINLIRFGKNGRNFWSML